MIILEKYRFLEKFVGLNPLGGRKSIVLQFIHLFIFILFNLMETIVFILNMRVNLNLASNAMCALCGVLPPMATYGHLLINRERYYSVLREMQDIVNRST